MVPIMIGAGCGTIQIPIFVFITARNIFILFRFNSPLPHQRPDEGEFGGIPDKVSTFIIGCYIYSGDYLLDTRYFPCYPLAVS